MLCNFKHGQLTLKATERYHFNLLSVLHFDSGQIVLLSAKFVVEK
jgi:hypothetical protein